MATILTLRTRKIAAAAARRRAAAPETFPDLMARLTHKLDWSEATVEDEYAAARAAYDILCGRPSARRSMAVA